MIRGDRGRVILTLAFFLNNTVHNNRLLIIKNRSLDSQTPPTNCSITYASESPGNRGSFCVVSPSSRLGPQAVQTKQGHAELSHQINLPLLTPVSHFFPTLSFFLTFYLYSGTFQGILVMTDPNKSKTAGSSVFPPPSVRSSERFGRRWSFRATVGAE